MASRWFRLLGACTVLSLILGLTAIPTSAEPLSGESLPVPATGQPGNQGDYPGVAKAIGQFQQQDYEASLASLKKAVAAHPELPPAQVIMAQFFFQSQQAAQARQMLELAVIEDPQDPEAYVVLGELALRERRLTEASLLLKKALDLLPQLAQAQRKENLQPRIYSGLSGVAETRGQWPVAQQYLETWLQREPKNAVAMQRLARALFQQKKAREALDQLKAAAAADPAAITPAAQFARFYQQVGDEENARKWMEYALQVAPKDLKTRLVAAQWALETGQVDEAKKHATVAMDIDPKSLEAKLIRGVVGLFESDYKTAELYFESAHLQAPDNFAASNNLALALAEQDDAPKRRRALEYAQANARQYSRMPEALSTFGWVLYRAGRVEDAEKVLRQAAATGEMKADTAYYLARVLVDRNQKDPARQLLTSALASDQPFAHRDDAKALLAELGG